jgi:hypothetical protein
MARSVTPWSLVNTDKNSLNGWNAVLSDKLVPTDVVPEDQNKHCGRQILLDKALERHLRDCPIH